VILEMSNSADMRKNFPEPCHSKAHSTLRQHAITSAHPIISLCLLTPCA